MNKPLCCTFMSPGPPWYAAGCRLPEGHEGDCDFGTVEEARANWESGHPLSARMLVAKAVNKPLFSILHASARPDKWREIYDAWMLNNADHPEDVEYVLCIDPRWGFSLDPNEYIVPLDNLLVVQNTGRRCYVDGVNIAAQASHGSILIVNADDQFPSKWWDSEILAALTDFPPALDNLENPAWVMEVSTGTPKEHERGVMVMPILSRKRYEEQGGFVFYPEYESMFADNDFCEWARRDGVVIDARHLMFPHKHVMFDEQGNWRYDWEERADKAYRAQNRTEAYEIGQKVYARRKASGFAAKKQRSIGLCIIGDRFEGAMFDSWLNLYAHLISLDFSVYRLRAYETNVYTTREQIRRVMMQNEPRPDLMLWLDDDNPLSIPQFDTLLADLDAHPEVDGIAGWCWIHNPGKTVFVPSCGMWAPDHCHWDPFESSFAREINLRSFECGGMPCLLMRMSALEKAGENPFLPRLDNRFQYGIQGEDFSFWLNAEQGGAKFLVDPRVRVPHLKYVEVNPVFESEGAPAPVKVACMIRAKNEGRWIARTIESVRGLCGENIFVMEDGSIDDTVHQAYESGATVWQSPFIGQSLDERRDKDWLMQAVIDECHPDWIIMPDGDEELEPGGCAKIRRALESNPNVDCFALRFLYLWDSVDQARFDGVYGTMQRQSLFRANSGLKFRSYYEGQDGHNHVGLHTSNSPGLGQMKVAPLNVFLLHYGYLHKEDRIRKYNWILSIDPQNETEDYYRHCVQGDVPEVPADMKLKIAGPLDVKTLPPHLIPRFEDGVPGPWIERVLTGEVRS